MDKPADISVAGHKVLALFFCFISHSGYPARPCKRYRCSCSSFAQDYKHQKALSGFGFISVYLMLEAFIVASIAPDMLDHMLPA
jgi:hypothetical protein